MARSSAAPAVFDRSAKSSNSKALSCGYEFDAQGGFRGHDVALSSSSANATSLRRSRRRGCPQGPARAGTPARAIPTAYLTACLGQS